MARPAKSKRHSTLSCHQQGTPMKFKANVSVLAIVAIAGFFFGAPARAVDLFTLSFDIDTGDTALTLSTYGLNSSITSVTVAGGQLVVGAGGAQSSVDFGSFVGDLTIGFDTTVVGSAGSINVGLRMGDNTFLFHPGYPTGAFRIDGPGGHPNSDMGFTPSFDPSRFTVGVNASTGVATIDIVNSAGSHHEVFNDPNYVAGSTTFGLSVGGSGSAKFDNLLVASPVPEPETYAMLLAGLGLIGAISLRRKAKKIS